MLPSPEETLWEMIVPMMVAASRFQAVTPPAASVVLLLYCLVLVVRHQVGFSICAQQTLELSDKVAAPFSPPERAVLLRQDQLNF
jgi:hypothetical protein